MVFEGAEIARDGVIGSLTNTVTKADENMVKLMGAVVGVVAVVLGALAVIKAISCISKKDYKQAAIFGVGALLCFVLAAIFVSGALRTTANTAVGNGANSGLNDVLF